MKDERKSKAGLIRELKKLRLRNAELEQLNKELEKKQEKIGKVEEKYRTLVEQIPAITYVAALDEQSTTQFVSPQVETMLGFSPSEWKEDNDVWLQQISPDDRERVLNEVTLTQKNGSPLLSEYRMITRDGRTIWMRDEANIVRDETDKPICLQGVMFDITENKAMLKALQNARDDLEHRVAERTAELSKANEKLMEEVRERKLIEESFKKSENKYRLLVETMNDGLAVHDENGIITYVNPKLLKMLGYKENKVIGHQLREFLDEADQEILIEQEVRRKKRERKSYELGWIGKDRRKVHTIISPSPIFDDEGNFKGNFAVTTDITELKAAQKSLRNSEERFRDIAHSMADWIWEINEKGVFTYCSGSIEEISHYSASEIIGKTPFDLMPPEEAKRAKKVFLKLAKKKEPMRNLENWNTSKNGELVCLLTNGLPILDERGNLKGYRGVDQNITERKRFEEALEKRGKELEEKNSSLQEMNAALRVLLKKREEDKKEIEQKVLTNVKELVLPYLKKLKQTPLGSAHQTLIGILESNLHDIVSPFAREISAKFLQLTPMELQVANLIRQGTRTKVIADLLDLSPKTIEVHRRSIRRKLGLINKKANLRSHLLSLQ